MNSIFSVYLPAARKLTIKQTTTVGHLSDAETSEEEQKNEFGGKYIDVIYRTCLIASNG